MANKTNDPKLKERFDTVMNGAKNDKEHAVLAAAEQAIISYYYDMLCAMMVRNIKATVKLELPDQAPMRKAVTELNRACANQKKPFLFGGQITSPMDLFTFASSIALPAAA